MQCFGSTRFPMSMLSELAATATRHDAMTFSAEVDGWLACAYASNARDWSVLIVPPSQRDVADALLDAIWSLCFEYD